MRRLILTATVTALATIPLLISHQAASACTWAERLDPTNSNCHIIEPNPQPTSNFPSQPSQPRPEEDLYSRANEWIYQGFSCLEIKEYPATLCRRFPNAKIFISINDKRVQTPSKPDLVRRCVNEGSVALYKASANYIYCVDSSYR